MSRYGLGFLANADGAPVPGNDAFTKVLLHMDGANGGTTFTDVNVGGGAHVWTPTNAVTATAQKKFGTSSAQLTSGYISTPNSFGMGTGDYTIDLFFNRNSNTGGPRGLVGNSGLSGTTGGWIFSINTSNQLQALDLAFNTAGVFSIHTTAVTDSLWHHAAMVKSSGNLMVALDGVFNAPVTDTQNIPTSDQPTYIGNNFNPYTGFIDEVRISVGIARWTSNFTPPTGPYS